MVEIRVEAYPSPISYKGEYHYRSGSTKQELKGSALEQFLLKKRGRHWDGVPESSFSAKACSSAAMRLFKQKATQSGRMDRTVLRDSRAVILENLELKDYSSGVPIQISVYDGKIVLWNPGQLPPGWTIERLLGKHPSNPPNPLLANAFFRAGYIESWGRGIEKIRRECREHDIQPPTYDFEMSGLMLTFHANPAYLQASSSESRANERLGEKLGETRAAIIRAMLANSKVTTTQLAKSLNISTTAVEKNIKFLKAQGLIARMGPAKGGYWKVRGAAF